MASLVIPIHNLDAHGKDFVFTLDQAWLDGAFEGTGVRGDASSAPGSVEVHAQRNGREVLVHGKARTQLVTECGRCLKGIAVSVACDLAALYAPSDSKPRASAADDDELDEVDPEAPDREYYSGEQIVVDDLVRDYLLLELPMQPRCELGWQCPNLDVPEAMRGEDGIHSQSSGEGRIDPRLIPLMKLAKGEPEKE